MSETKRTSDKLVFGLPPRADLLPPEFRAEAQLRRQRRGLVAIGALSVVVVILAYGYATFGAATSDLRHKSAIQETQSLLDQKAQYSDISTMLGRVDAIKSAQIVGAAPEIDWKSFLEQLRTTLPEGMSMESVGAVAVEPGKTTTSPDSPLERNNIATLEMLVNTKTISTISQWINSLGLLPGFVSADVGSISKLDGGGYSANVTMRIDSGALAHRFDADLPPAPVDEPGTDEVAP
jgi:Tfp pilus assembly protein PilN